MSEEREVDAEEIASTHASALAEVPYAVEEFAEKYGLSRKAADVILIASGPSRQKSDAGARVFLAAVAEFLRR